MYSMFKPLLRWAGIAALVALPSFGATTVGLELSLLVDVSGSIDYTEFNLQKTGYVNAFNSAAVQNAILNSTDHSIAVNLIYWSSATEQSQVVGWTIIDSVASAQAFAAAIAATTQIFEDSTAPGSAINYAVTKFTNGIDSVRQVIDVSGDGVKNDGADTITARNAALAAGIDQINGLPILGSEYGLEAWYQNNIQGGTDSFTMAATTFTDFSTAIEAKLVREITGVPEPASIVLLVTMLGLSGFAARRKFVRN
jgi:hypothetical protein